MIKKLKNKKVLIIGLLILGLGGFFGFRYISNKKNSANQAQQNLTVTVQKGNLRDTVSASGQIETANYLAVTTSVNGIVKQVFVKEGDAIAKGQKIMEITLNSEGEESLAQAWSSYLSAKNSLESAKRSLITKESALITAEENFQDEKESNSYQSHDERVSYKLAENSYLVAKQDYDSQKDTITQAEVNLNKAWLTYQAQSPTIVAPGEGVIANIVVVEGMDITNSLSERTSATVASIRKEGTPIASLNVSEVDINKVKVGQKAELSLGSAGNKVFTGTIVGIDKIGTTASGVSNYPVIVKFDNNSDQVLPNMGVEGTVIIEEKENVLYVPSSAIGGRGDRAVVQRKNGETVPVQTGLVTTEFTEILSGLNEGDEITVSSLPTQGFTPTTNNSSTGRSNRGGVIPFPGR